MSVRKETRMRKIAVMVAMLVSMCGCDYFKPIPQQQDVSNDTEYSRVVIDGCQYIRSYGSLVHKGNCTNHVTVIKNYGQIIIDGKLVEVK